MSGDGSLPAQALRPSALDRAVPWAATGSVLLVMAWLVLQYSTPLLQAGAYLFYVVCGVLLPGMLVHKALRGPQDSWLADVALGAATGMALGLAAWAVAGITGLWALLWVWPVLTLLVLLSPVLRARVRSMPAGRWRPWPTVGLALAALVAMWRMASVTFAGSALPPSGSQYYPDLLWHMGLAAEATRAFPLGTPQVVGEGALHYHWFANAYVAVSSLMSGVDVQTIMLRLWVLPMVLVILGLTAALTQQVSGSPAAAAGAAWLVLPVTTYPMWPSIVPRTEHISADSPSQLFAYPMMLLTIHALVDVVRGRGGKGALATALVGALAASGSKTSALPVILGGLGAAFLAALILRRRRLLLLTLTAVTTIVVAVALKLVSGGYTGSGLQFLSSLTILLPYRVVVGWNRDFTTLLPLGLTDTPGAGWLLAIGLLLATMIGALRSIAFLAPFFQRALRHDLAAWLLAGVCVSAFVAFFAIGHPGFSEYYFLYGTIPVGSALWMWALSVLVRQHRVSTRVLAVTFGLGAVLAAVLGRRATAAAQPQEAAPMMQALTTFVVQVGCAALAVAVALGYAAVRRRRGRGSAVAPVVMAALLSPLLGSTILQVLPSAQTTSAEAPEERAVLLAESQAAVWIRSHVPNKAVMATNVYCLKGEPPHCDARRWWISGLAGRRVLLEGWAYVPSAVARGGPDPQLLALNEKVFVDPSAATVAPLRARGVTWLVAETLPPHDVPASLDSVARKRYTNGIVTVYELPGTSAP